MIKFWTYQYQLHPWHGVGPKAEAKPRKGALLKVEWSNGLVGYGDIFPWEDFGDAPIEDQIKALAQGKISPLVEQTIWLAKRDATLRKTRRNAFAGAPKIKNHFLISDFTRFTDDNMKEARTAGFTTFKVKVGRAVNEEAKFCIRTLKQNPVTLRLDFNGKSDFSEFERFFSHLSTADRAKIEFVEDPVAWSLEAWKECAKFCIVAVDLEGEKIDFDKFTSKPPFSIMVIKPARQDVEKTLKVINKYALKMVVTSSMDHPVGIAHALLQAAELKKFYPNTLLDCGCLTMRTYKPNDFSNLIQTTGPFLKEIPGTGIGFNDLLEKLEWTSVTK